MILEVMQRRFLADSIDGIGTSLRAGVEDRNPSVRALLEAEKVDPADVKRAANTYMRNLQFVVLGDPRQIDKGIFAPPAGE